MRAAMPAFPFLEIIPVNLEAGEIPIYIEVLCPERDCLVGFLRGHGIEARPFYPDLDLASYYIGNVGDFQNSRKFGQQGLFLPGSPEQPIKK